MGSARKYQNQVPNPWSIPAVNGIRMLNSRACARARDRALLGIDSFLFEFRAYLDLLARFVHGVLNALDKGPAQTETSSGGTRQDYASQRKAQSPRFPSLCV